MRIDIKGGRAVLEGIPRADAATREGAAEGLRKSTSDLARDVAQHTPVRSGAARQSVVERVSKDGRTGRVTYDYKKRRAWYMRVILLGTYKKPGGYPIGRKYKTAKSLDRARARAGRKAYKAAIGAGKSEAEATAAIESARKRVADRKRRALAYMWMGRLVFRDRVPHHPALKPKPILTDRLAANRDRIFNTIIASVGKRLSAIAHVTRR